ncbi:hypothetical protein Trydic_g20054 [Trypoxylus dichotomus]
MLQKIGILQSETLDSEMKLGKLTSPVIRTSLSSTTLCKGVMSRMTSRVAVGHLTVIPPVMHTHANRCNLLRQMISALRLSATAGGALVLDLAVQLVKQTVAMREMQMSTGLNAPVRSLKYSAIVVANQTITGR